LVVIGTSRRADVVRVGDLFGCVTEASASRSAILYSPVRLAATERAVRLGDGRGDVACVVAAESAAGLKCACAWPSPFRVHVVDLSLDLAPFHVVCMPVEGIQLLIEPAELVEQL
jgi:hypothetical protein